MTLLKLPYQCTLVRVKAKASTPRRVAKMPILLWILSWFSRNTIIVSGSLCRAYVLEPLRRRRMSGRGKKFCITKNLGWHTHRCFTVDIDYGK